MQLSEFQSDKSNQHTKEGNPSVTCNALYKSGENINCYLKASQAVEFARHLLSKAQIILDHGIDDGVVHVWSQGAKTEKLYFGLTKARKGARRKAKPAAKPV